MKTLWISMRKHPIILLAHTFIAFSVAWTATEALNHFFGWAGLKSGEWFTLIVVGSIFYSFYSIWRPVHVVIDMPLSNISIEVTFGDLFELDGHAVIPVNEFFDTKIGPAVSSQSLHGLFITEYFGGYGDALDKQLSSKLVNQKKEIIERTTGKFERFPIGTTVSVETKGQKFIMLAFSSTDIITNKASADVLQLFQALDGLWQGARAELSGDALNLPLIGSGLSGVGLPPRELINIIILSFIDESKRQLVTRKLRIILTKDRIDEVNLREIKNHWEVK